MDIKLSNIIFRISLARLLPLSLTFKYKCRRGKTEKMNYTHCYLVSSAVFLILRGVFDVLATFCTFSFLTSSFFTTTSPSSPSPFSGLTVTFLSLCLPLMGAEKVSEDLMKSRGKMPTSPSKRFLVTCRDLRPGHVTSFFSCRMRTLSASWLAWKRSKVKVCLRWLYTIKHIIYFQCVYLIHHNKLHLLSCFCSFLFIYFLLFCPLSLSSLKKIKCTKIK